MIEVFKITHNIYDTTGFFQWKANTRGNYYKLHNHPFHYDLQKRFFPVCIVNNWNSLPNSVVDACTVNGFKARLISFGSTKQLNMILQPIWWVPKSIRRSH